MLHSVQLLQPPIFPLPITPFTFPSTSPCSFILPPKRTLPLLNISCSRDDGGATTNMKAEVVVEEGPVELPSSVFANSNEPTPLQTATSLLLTGAISVFLFRSLRRRAKRAKDLKFRSSGAKKSLKEEAMESLKALSPTLNEGKSSDSPVQALIGGLAAGAIALLLYKFTLTIEDGLNRQTLSENFSVRQITITIRTIINGICYLATFVFGINAVGLFLYSGQLAMNSFMEVSPSGETSNSKQEEPISSTNSTKGLPERFDEGSSEDGKKSDDRQQ
ncbi:hypothetical protein LIER_04488 [Lithospermum erythrorhizon]|uniref:Transmembrane protein n=1 Tax=Lithospermum erythrorhizon TaxID=34254 RepID=A0AAV3NZN8_LITER